MLQFLRRIRKKLIEDGKFKNYLLYAVGELFLVVLGILIALQINALYQKKIDANSAINVLY